MPTEFITARPGPEWKRAAAALGKINGTLPRDLPRVIKRKGPSYLSEVKGRALSLPTPRDAGHTGLRARVAAGTRMSQATGGVQFESSLPGNQAIIPAGLDSMTGSGGWFHPVWGRRPFVFQKGYSWFTKPLLAKNSELEGGLDEVLNDAAEFVARHGA